MKMTKLFSLLAALACATSLSAATLQSLVTNEHKDGGVIVVPNGTYEPSNLRTETRKLTFRAETDGGVIIDGGNTARCVDLSDSITLEGFVLQNGKADRGGGVRGGTVIRTTIQNCSATFGGGSYQTRAYVSTYKANTAEFFGMAAYGGSAFSCRVEGNASATYGGGMGALFGVTVANTSVTGNTALHDNAGVLLSPAQNMVYFGNVAQRGLYEGAPMVSANTLGSEDENSISVADKDIFVNAAAGDYTLNVNTATLWVKDLGDLSLDGHYDELWHDTDIAGRPRMLGASIDLGPYEIADTFTVTCNVVGVGLTTVSPNFIQEGDPVTLTAQQDADYAREFLGFYVNGELISRETTCTYNPVSTDKIEARFAGLSATTDTLAKVLTQLHPSIREEVKLADGAYTINGLTKPVAFVGSSIGGTTITLSDDCKGSFFINATVTGTASNATLHRSLASGFSGSDLTLTSSIITSNCGTMSGTAVNVTAYTTMPADLTCTDCVTLNNDTTNTVAGAILPKGNANIDAGQGSEVTPYDNLDIAGRPRKMGNAIDRGAHECHYMMLTVAAEGYYQTLMPEVGTSEKLAGETIALGGTSPRTFKGWTLGDGTVVSETLSGTYVLPEKDVTLTAVFAGFTMNPGDSVPGNTQAADTITLTAGTYAQTFNTTAKIVGTGAQGDVILTGTITDATLEAVTLQGATLSNVTLNRCYVNGGRIETGKVYNSILVNVTSATGTYINNTTVNTMLPGDAINTRVTTEGSYTPTEAEADKGDALSVDIGNIDYYGNPRVNNGTIDAGAVEYVWPPYVVTINVIGHGLVEPRGSVEVVRGETLTFTVAEDPKHPRGTATVTGATLVDGVWTITPSADCVVTVTFPGLTVDSNDDLAAVVVDAQDGETITVAPGTYGAIDVKSKRVKIVASSSNPDDTIIDAQGLKRAVKLAEGAEIIGFTIQNGLSNEGAGVYGGTVRRSVIRWNKLTYNGFGAGVCNTFAESCLIVDNGSTAVERSNGGGAANSELLNCTVVRNVADKGAGLYDCTAKNAVVALNVDLTGATSDWTGDSVEPDPTDCCTPTTGGIAVDAASIFVDPANNDWRLREGIACINAGKADERLSATDLMGNARVYGTALDMGAIEWNAPNYQITIAFQGRGQVETLYFENGNEPYEVVTNWDQKTVLSLPRTVQALNFKWSNAGTKVTRTFKGIYINGEKVKGSEDVVNGYIPWTIVAADTVNATLVFTAEDVCVTPDTVADALSEAIPGEVIVLEAGTYATPLAIPQGAVVMGRNRGTALVTGGVTLADGALLKQVTVKNQGIVGPESGAATVLHSIVTEVNGTAIQRNVVVKTSLIHNNAGVGVMDATVYLSTIVDNRGKGVLGNSKVYGSIVSGNGVDLDAAVTVVDSYVGGVPRFILPAPDGDNYALMSSSPAIDVAKTAQWEGFTDADRALTDLAGNPRPRLAGYDAGAYEVQGAETAADIWTWYGADYTMDGNVSGAYWRKTSYGAPFAVPEGDRARIVDRAGYSAATLYVDGRSTFGNLAIDNVKTAVRIADAGGTWTIDALTNKTTTGALTLAAKMNVWSAFQQNAGTLTIEEDADVTVGGTFTAANSSVQQTGGTLTVESDNTHLTGSASYTINGGVLNFGNNLYLRNTANLTVAGGEVKGDRISIAQQNREALTITGGTITVNRLETGDEQRAWMGNVVQTGGTVNLMGSGSGKKAPLHISHWPTWDPVYYTLRGGELYVPNGEVRLGNDGKGALRLEGGVARLKSVAISSGRVQLAGGTYEALAPATTLTAEVERNTVSTLRACEGDVTGLTLNLTNVSGSGNIGTVRLASGIFNGSITDQNVMLNEGVTFKGMIDHATSGLTLTLPGTGYATIDGSYQPSKIALSSDPILGKTQKILEVRGTTEVYQSDVTLTGKWASCCDIEVNPNYQTNVTEVYVTRTGSPSDTVVVPTVPTLTVDGDTKWSDREKWSSYFISGDAVVRAVSDATLTMNGATIEVNTLTFDVPEGVTLTVVTQLTAADYPNINTVKKTGLGTLKWASLINYTDFDEGEGSFIAAAAGQNFGGKAFEKMAFRAEARVSLDGQSQIHATIADGVTLTLKNGCKGDVTVEGNAELAFGTTATYSGDLIVPSGTSLTIQGSSAVLNGKMLVEGSLSASTALSLGGEVTLVGTVDPANITIHNTLKQLTLNQGNLTLTNCQWPDGAKKNGAGCLTFSTGATLGGAAIFSGPVTFTDSLTTTGVLHFKSDAVVTIPYGRTLTANDEIRVEPGARFIIMNPPTNLTDEVVQSLLISTKTAGLRVDQLASVSLAWAGTPDASLSNPIPSLAGESLNYTVRAATVKRWTGAVSSDWLTADNWSSTGDAVLFTSDASQQSVVVGQGVEPSLMTISSGTYTFSGQPLGGKPSVTQGEAATVTWQTFFTRGAYMLQQGAIATLSLGKDWTYGGSFSGSGELKLANGRFALTSASNGFAGNVTVEQGATLRLCNENALYNGAATLKEGTLSVETPTALAALTVDGGTLSLSTDMSLDVRTALTGESLSVVVTNITEAGDWTILTYPSSATTTFSLADRIDPSLGLKAALKRNATELILMVRSSDNIEWTGTKTVSGVTTDVWKVNNLDVEVGATNNKHLFFNDVNNIATASVALPLLPRSLTVTAQNTYYTLSGDLGTAPITVTAGAAVTLATSAATPTAVKNEGVITVMGILDLTQAALVGKGQYVAGEGGVIRIGAQALVDATATFVRGAGQIVVIADQDFDFPEGRVPTAEGVLLKEGAGTLYLPSTALAQPLDVRQGTVMVKGAMALKARYFKFEALERFNQTLNNSTKTGLSDFVTMLNGQAQPWSDASAIVRFDSGSTNRIQIGITDDAQSSIDTSNHVKGTIADLIDNTPHTELTWGEWHATYRAGEQHSRNYFVVDAGADGMLFTGYNVATPAALESFFWKWNVSIANDISNWRPGTHDAAKTANEDAVWQSIHEETLPQTTTTAGLTASAWLKPAGYLAQRSSGLWSSYADITVAANATLDLTRASGTSGVLIDQVEVNTLTGDGTVIVPSNLQVKANTFSVNTLQLTGTKILREPIVAKTATFKTVVVSEAMAAAYNSNDKTKYTLVEGYAGDVPELQGMAAPSDGGSWTLKKDGTTLVLALEGSQRELFTTVTQDTDWRNLAWYDAHNAEVTNIDWTKVRVASLVIPEAASNTVTVSMPAELVLLKLAKVVVDYGQTTDKALVIDGQGALSVESLVLSGQNRSAFLPRSTAVFTCDNLEVKLPKWDTSVSFVDTLGGNNTYTPPALEMGIHANGEETLRTYLAGGNLVVLRSGTIRLSREEQFAMMVRDIRVDAEATLDVNGCPISNNVCLNGGTLANTGNAISVNKRQTYNITLTADSTVTGTSEYYSLANGYNVHTLNLNGHTLTKRGSNTFIVHNANIEGGNGKIVVESGTFKIQPQGSQTRTMKNVEIIANGGNVSITGVNTLQGRVVLGAGVVCSNNIELAENATLAGSARIEGNLSLGTGAVLEATSTITALDVRGTITPADVTMRLGNQLTTMTTAIPLIAVKDKSAVNVMLSNQPNATTMAWTGDVLYLVPEGMSSSVTEVKATIAGDANWSTVQWTDMNGTAVTPDWRSVTTVTLTLTKDATVTRDVATLALSSLTMVESDYTLTLEGAALPSTLTTLAANTAITFGEGVLSTIPTALSGTKNLTFTSTVASTASGGETTFAYNDFTGNWIVESGATLNLNGDGGIMGVMNTTGADSGVIIVKQSATVALNGHQVFGMGDAAKQCTRKVLVVDGGHVEITTDNTKCQSIRRTLEFKNGASLNSSNSDVVNSHGISFARGANILVTEGEVTFSGHLGIGCHNDYDPDQQQEAIFNVSEKATLKIPGWLKNGANSSAGGHNGWPVHYMGAGTIVVTGTPSYSYFHTFVSGTVTVLVNASHLGRYYEIRNGASLGGTGKLSVPVVKFKEGAKLSIVDVTDPFEISVMSTDFPGGGVSITPPEGLSVDTPAKLFKSNMPISVGNFALTDPDRYVLDVVREGSSYVLTCKQRAVGEYAELVADVTGETEWDAITWKTPEGSRVDKDTLIWSSVGELTFRVAGDAAVTLPANLNQTLTSLSTLKVAFTGENAQLTLSGSNVVLPTVTSTDSGTIITQGAIEITSALSGTGALTVASGTLTLSGNSSYIGNTTIRSGATLALTRAEALATGSTYTGAGTLSCAGFLPSAITDSLKDNNWTGTVKIDTLTAFTGLKLSDFGNKDSVLHLKDLGTDTGNVYLANESYEVAADLVLEGKNYINNGYAAQSYTFSGNLSGSGWLTWGTFGTPADTYYFTGEDFSKFTGKLIQNRANKIVLGDTTGAEGGVIRIADAIDCNATLIAKTAIKVATSATVGGEGTLGSAVTFENDATLDLTKGVLTAQSSVGFDATLKVIVGNDVSLDNLVILKKADNSITTPVDVANVKVAVNGGDATYSMLQTSAGYVLRAKTVVRKLTAKAGQSFSNIFDSATEMLAPEATLVIDFGTVEGETAKPSTFTFDNAGAVSFASITVQGSNGGTLLKTGTGAVTCTTFTRDAACTDLTLDVSLFSAAYTGNQTIDGWALGLHVPAEATATLTNVFTVNAGATLKKVGEGTLTLSGGNNFRGTLKVEEGVLIANAATNGSEDNNNGFSGMIVIAEGATLQVYGTNGSDSLAYGQTVVVDVAGTLNLNTHRWTLGANTTIRLRPGAVVSGTGQSISGTLYGALDWNGEATIQVMPAANSVGGEATLAANIRFRTHPQFVIDAGMSLTLSGNVLQNNAGVTLTKSGAGTLVYQATTPGTNKHSVSVTAGALAGAGSMGNELTMATGTTLALPAEGTLSVAGTVTFGESLNITVAENVTLADKLIIAKADDSITEATLVNTRITVNGTNMDYYLVQTNAGYALKVKEDVTTLSGTAGQSLSQLFNAATQKIGASATLAINFGDIEVETANPGTFTFDNANDITFASITITGSNGGTLTKTGTGAVAATATAVTNTQVTIPAETAVLGTVSIAEGAKVIVADTTTVTSVRGVGTLEMQAAEAGVDYNVVKGAAFAGTAIATASGENGTVIENTNKVTWPEGKQFIFNGGTHALTFYPGAFAQDKQDETEETASIQVKSNTTLTLKAKDFAGWSGFNADMALSVKGQNAKVIAAPFGDDPGCFTGRVFLADGATIQGGDTFASTLNFFGDHDDANIYVTSGEATWTNKFWIGQSGNGKGGATLDIGVTVDEGATFNLAALLQNTNGLEKNGAGTIVISGENTTGGTLTVNAGKASITGTWAGATTVAANGTLSGAGTIGGALAFTEGATLVVDPNAATPLMVNGAISGVAQLSFTGEVIQRTAVIASAQTIQTSSFVPPAGYTFAVETVDGVNTLYVTPAPITKLVATLSGEVAWEDIEWMTPEGATVDISTIGVSQVATLTLNLEADAQLTFVDDVTEIFPALTQIYVDSELASDVALTICGNVVTLPTVKVSMRDAPMTFRSEAKTLSVGVFSPLITMEYGLGIDVAFLNSCTTPRLPTTYRLMGDGIVQKNLSDGVQIKQGKVTVGNELSSVTALSIESGATLKVTTKAALTNFLSNEQLALNSTALRGAGTLELAFADAKTILEMTGTGGNFSGDILVTSGTLKFPNGGENGPGKNRVITVTGANAALATGTNNDATGWSIAARQSIVLTEQGKFKVYKRDTFKTPITMAGGIIRLMETAEDSGRGLDWFNSPTLTVNALEGASVASPTDSYITYVDGAAGATIKMNIRDGSFPVEVNEKARLTVDVNLYGGELTKTGVGELVLTNAENSYGATTINAGTLTVTGATGTGATTMAVGTTLRGTGTVKGDLTFTNTTETVEDVPTITGWPTFEVDVTTGAAPLTVTGTITGKAKLAFTGDIASLASIAVVISTQESVADSFEGIPDGFTFTKVGNMHILVNENAQEYTALYAKVAGDTKWSQLTWSTDAEGTEIVTTSIAWDLVESVTLTAEANATVTRDVTTAALTSLTVMDSEYTLTLAGYALPETSTLVVDGALCLSEGVVTTMPNLSGAGALTFMGGEIISMHAGSDGTNYAYDDFTGHWVLANGTTMRIRGVGAQKGQLNWNSTVEGSGQIEVRQGAHLVLEAQNVFGWGAVNELHQRKVLVVDGGEVEISTAENYIRRTIELKNGATLACPATNSTVYFSRGATIEVTEGEATISGMLNVSCDNAGSSVGKGATIRVNEEATLNFPGSIAYGKNGNIFALTYTGGGTVNVTGENSYHTYTETIVDEGTTFIMNGTHIAPGENTLKPYTFKAGATLMGAGTINGAVTFNAGAVVVADGQPLTLGAVTAESTFVEVTANLEELDAAATVFTATNNFDATKFTTSAAYVLEKTSTTVGETTTYALVVKRASTVTVTGTNDFDATTQQVLSDLVVDTLKEKGVTSGVYAVAVEVYTKGSETPKTPSADEVDALLGCFINVETVDIENNTATVKIEYEFGLAGVTVDADLNVIFTATVEGPSENADYVDGVSFTIKDEGTQETWEIGAENIDFISAPKGSVFLTLPDTYEVGGQRKSVLTDFIGTRQFKVKVSK